MEPFIAEIIMFGGSFAPRGWAFCDGQLLSIAENSALFSILGTDYGGDGRTTFGLPDLRSRVPVHAGSGPGLSTIRRGEKSGNEATTLSIANMPSHNHDENLAVAVSTGTNNTDDPDGAVLASGPEIYNDGAPDADMGDNSITGAIENTGGGQGFSNRQPFTAVNFIIALVGIFPSRN
jgi:microcystin-dependent protein